MRTTRIVAVVCLAALLIAAAPAPPAATYARMYALEAQRSLGNGELARDLASRDVDVAARAALAIGRTRLAAGAPLLVSHLGDKRDPVRAFAIYGLGLIGDAAAAPQIIAATTAASGAVRIAALDALGRYEVAGLLGGNEANAESAVAAALAGDTDVQVRSRAATELAAFNKGVAASAAASALTAVLSDRRGNVRWHAIWSIFRSYPTAVPRSVLIGALSDTNELVRIEAVRALGRLNDPSVIAVLQPLLDDPSWRVQEQANESTLALSGKPTNDHLATLLPNLHLPPVVADPLASLPAMTRPTAAKPGKPGAPVDAFRLHLHPTTAADMLGPVHGAHPRVRIVTTKGNLYLTLYPEWAPYTVENFLNVARLGYFDNNRWFRIVPDFVVQGGDPNDNGDGDAGFTIGAEENPLEQTSFIISMGMNYTNPPNAHAIRDSAGTQFYITLSPQLHLNRDFTVFGTLTAGQDVLARLVESDRMIRVDRIADVQL